MKVKELYEMIENCRADAEVQIQQVYGAEGPSKVTGMIYSKDRVILTDEDTS